ALASKGLRVLMLEKEIKFKDRVRGEYIVPWGVAEAKTLGIETALLQSCATEVPWLDMGFGPRNLVETTPQRLPGVAFFHPEMQETLLANAQSAGAQVRRGVSVTSVEAGSNPSIVVASNGHEERISARLVVIADGRGSVARKWAGFSVATDPHPFYFSGVLLEGVPDRRDMGKFVFNPEFGLVAGLVPQSKNRFRAYLGYPADAKFSLNGIDKLSTFFAESRKVGPMFADTYTQAKSL